MSARFVMAVALGYYTAAILNAIFGDPLGRLGRRLRDAWRWLGDAAESSHRGQRDRWAAEPDELPRPDTENPRHRKDQS